MYDPIKEHLFMIILFLRIMKPKSEAKRIIAPDGIEVFYWITFPKGTKRPFRIMYPGASMNHSSLTSLEQGLNERGYPTLALDPRGWGYSQAPADRKHYRIENYSGDLNQILAQEGIENPLFVGHSFGFSVIADYVARTGNASQIVGVCSSYNFKKTANKIGFAIFDFGRYIAEPLASLATETVYALSGRSRPYNDQSGAENKSEFGIWLSIIDVPMREIESHITSGIKIARWDISEQLQQIKTPTLIIQGAQDPIASIRAGYEIANLILGECYVEVLDGMHSLPMKRPEAVLNVMDKFDSQMKSIANNLIN